MSPCPDPLPKVGGAVTVWVRWVARSPVVAKVEGEKPGLLARQLGGHGHLVGVDGEVDQGAPGEGHVGGVAVSPVLGDGVLDVLIGERILELGRSRWDAIDEER